MWTMAAKAMSDPAVSCTLIVSPAGSRRSSRADDDLPDVPAFEELLLRRVNLGKGVAPRDARTDGSGSCDVDELGEVLPGCASRSR